MATIGKRIRAKLMDKQHGQCALCGYHFGAGKQICYDKHKHTLVCNSCMLFLNGWRSVRERNVTLPMMCEYAEKVPDNMSDN